MSVIERLTTEHFYHEIEAAATQAAPLFTLYGWTYGEDHVPTHSELKKCITELAEHALNYFYQSDEQYRDAEVGSGRFSVRVKEYADEVMVTINLNLEQKEWFKAQPQY